MSSAKANVKIHNAHGWEIQDVSHIKNVPLTETHFLMQCPGTDPTHCKWRGWVIKDLLSTPL